MASFNVQVDHEEGNESTISVTGRVNGIEVAAVLARARVPATPGNERTAFLAHALVDAFQKRTTTPLPGGLRIEV